MAVPKTTGAHSRDYVCQVTGCDRAGFTFAHSAGALGDQRLHRWLHVYRGAPSAGLGWAPARPNYKMVSQIMANMGSCPGLLVSAHLGTY